MALTTIQRNARIYKRTGQTQVCSKSFAALSFISCGISNFKSSWNSSSSLVAPYFATLGNQSCNPFSPELSPCRLGNLVNYAVNVSTPNDAVAAVQFAKNHNIRFVIRNTGHE